MPPKKATEDVKSNVVAFGRVRKNLKMGCVSLPNVGKSSLFNLLTEQSAPAESYPFCTIEPNEARCAVPDARYVSYYSVIRVMTFLGSSESALGDSRKFSPSELLWTWAMAKIVPGLPLRPLEASLHVSCLLTGN